MLLTEMIFPLIGGIGFFFFGMEVVSEGLRKVAGEQLKKILYVATKIPVFGVIVGAIVTFLVQSSSAMVVMVIGFTNAGLLTLKQAISVVIGANIGTTFTGWIISSISVFGIVYCALPAVGVGYILMQVANTNRLKFTGKIIMGLGFLFLGLSFMQEAFSALKSHPQVLHAFVVLSKSPILGVLIGIIVAAFIHSSAAIAVVQLMAFQGIIGYEAAIPLILGSDVGTTITAHLAAIGTNLRSRRAAMAHTLFNVAGVIYMLAFIYLGWFHKLVDITIANKINLGNVMFYLAVTNTIFKVINAALFLPFMDAFEKICKWTIPQKDSLLEVETHLDKNLLNTPTIALRQARQEIVQMLDLAGESLFNAMEGFFTNNKKALKIIERLEQAVDNLQSEITQYLVELSQKNLDADDSRKLPVLIHSVNDIERIGDHAEHIGGMVTQKIETDVVFSETAMSEIRTIWKELYLMLREVREALEAHDYALAKRALRREHRINDYQREFKKTHVERLNEGKCNIKSSLIFLDMIDNLERIGDHLANIAYGVISKMRWQAAKGKSWLAAGLMEEQ